MKNPYDVLGLTKSASQEDIKKAYRSLVKKYHPDKNAGNKAAEEKFKEIAHAFDLIGTEEARGKYDRGETTEQQQEQYQRYRRSYGNPFGHGFGQSYSQTDQDFTDQDFFEHLFKEARRSQRPKRSFWGDENLGEDHQYKMEVEFKESILGSEKVITLQTGKQLQIKIPPGIESGKKLRFKGQGGNGGDAYVEIVVRPSDVFKRVKDDIEVEVSISFIEAILGAEIPVPTVDGTVMVKVPAGVTTGSRLRVKGKGVSTGKIQGDQIVKIIVETPKKVDPNLAQEIKNLSQKYSFNPRH